MKRGVIPAALTWLVFALGCTVGPRYSRPAAPAAAPDAWKAQPPWEQAAPRDAIPKGAWWQIFHDRALDDYEQQLLQANQSLVAARDRLEEARSLARVSTAAMFPQLSVDPSALRERAGANRPLNGAGPTTVSVPGLPQPITLDSQVTSYTQNVFTIPFALSYEVDLFRPSTA